MAEAEKPAPTALVKVFGISVNPADWHSMRCKPLFSRATLGLLRLKYRIVVDIAGLVKAVGGSVTRFERGDGCPGAHQRRILDTAYGKWLDVPLGYAQLIVALDYPRWFSLQRLVRRTVTRLFDRRLICNGNRESLRGLFSRDSIISWHFRSVNRKRQRIRRWSNDPAAPPVMRLASFPPRRRTPHRAPAGQEIDVSKTRHC